MRISDWSSDVCSSDLPREPAPREKVDDFQRLLQGKREQREPRLPTQPEEARQPQQAARREGQQAPTRQQEDAAIAGHRQASERYGDDPALRHRDDTGGTQAQQTLEDRKSTRLNSSH